MYRWPIRGAAIGIHSVGPNGKPQADRAGQDMELVRGRRLDNSCCTLRAAPSGLGQSVCASRGHTVARRELQAGGPELAAGGHDVAPARRAYRARVARLVDDLGEALDLLPVGAFVRCTRP